MVRKLLNELKWHPQKSLKDVYIVYIHRGVPGDKLIIPAEGIKLEKSFFVVGGTKIPYHRIVEVRKGDKVIWRRKNESKRIHV